jgi:hypothetical protein
MTLYTTIRIPIERKNRNIPPTCKRDPSPLMLFMGILLPTYGPKRVFFTMVCFANTPLPAVGIEEHFTYKLAGSVSMAYWGTKPCRWHSVGNNFEDVSVTLGTMNMFFTSITMC